LICFHEFLRSAEFPYYIAKPVKVNKTPGTWHTCEVGIFEVRADGSETQIGSYHRNYAFLETFWWFRRGERHFALYSPDYTATRVMEIYPAEGFKDIGGEEPASYGFCPVEFYVPDCRQYGIKYTRRITASSPVAFGATIPVGRFNIWI
jgi:hypothetical protein